MIRRLLPFLLLAGCAAPQPTTRIITLIPTLPAAMLNCAAAPVIPQAASQAEVANYIVNLWMAGRDCRTHLAAVRGALATTPDSTKAK